MTRLCLFGGSLRALTVRSGIWAVPSMYVPTGVAALTILPAPHAYKPSASIAAAWGRMLFRPPCPVAPSVPLARDHQQNARTSPSVQEAAVKLELRSTERSSMAARRNRMRQLAPGFAAQEEAVASLRGVETHYFKELFQTVCHMEADSAAGQPDLPVDSLDRRVYHALLVAHLSKLAEHPSPSAREPLSEAARMDRLQEAFRRLTSGLPQLDYTVVGICSTRVSPATLVKHGSTLYVACRGTKSLAEKFADLHATKAPIDGFHGLSGHGRAHAGFLNAFGDLEADVLARVDGQIEGVEEVVFCGYSLGGTVSQLLGLLYEQQGKNAPVVSFGCPRLGDTTLRHTLDDSIAHHRLYVRRDPFPAEPFWYAPHGGTVRVGAGGWKLASGRRATIRRAEDPKFTFGAPWPTEWHALPVYAEALNDHRSLVGNRAVG